MQRRWVVSPDYRSVIQAVQAARSEKGLTQTALAERLGKGRSFINKIENLERRLDILEFIAIAQALDIEPRDLIDRLVAVLPRRVEL